jgi:hypothetical protein
MNEKPKTKKKKKKKNIFKKKKKKKKTSKKVNAIPKAPKANALARIACEKKLLLLRKAVFFFFPFLHAFLHYRKKERCFPFFRQD